MVYFIQNEILTNVLRIIINNLFEKNFIKKKINILTVFLSIKIMLNFF